MSENIVALASAPSTKINLNDQEKKILSSILEIEALNSIRPYLSQILLDGAIPDADLSRVDEYIIDWEADNVDTGNPLPKPLAFIRSAVLGRAQGGIMQDPMQGLGTPYGASEQPVIDMENLPSYLPKVYDLIEKEVRRRVREEMKEHGALIKKYDELKKKFEYISQLISV